MKHIISVMLCLAMMLSLAQPVFAEEMEDSVQTESGTITESPESGESEESQETQPSHSHSWDNGTVTQEATCVTDGSKTYSCACGAVSTEVIAATGHGFGQWETGESGHQRVCSCYIPKPLFFLL